jgi:lipid A 3-O-deacylase
MNRCVASLLTFFCAVMIPAAASSAADMETKPPDAPPQSELFLSAEAAAGEKGRTEFGLISGAATNIPGGINDRGIVRLSLRWGRVITAPHGPEFLRGTFQYSLELQPAVAIRQPVTAFGAGITPVLLQYNFTRGRRHMPFVQAGAGVLLTNRKVPEGTSQLNFTPQAGIGMNWFARPHTTWSFGARFEHLSNLGIADHNPGHNSLFIYTGFSFWR